MTRLPSTSEILHSGLASHELDVSAFESHVPAPVLEICRQLAAAGYQAFLVGGAIRDLILGRPVNDFDVATSARPEQVAQVFGKRRTIPTGAAHGTVTVLFEKAVAETSEVGLGVEVTTFRGEGAYADGRRPDQVVFLDDIVEDLRRRDFTINAMAIRPSQADAPGISGATHEPWKLIDPFGGLADLRLRLIRAVGVAADRFTEDGLRIMRAVRFAAQLGFTLEPATLAAIPEALPIFRKVSLERVRDELLKLLASPRPSVGLRLLQTTGMLEAIIPELCESVGHPQNRYHSYDVWEHTMQTVDYTPGDAICRMGALLHDVAKPRTAAPKDDAPGEFSFFRHESVGAKMADEIGRRLRLSNKERERVVALVDNHMFWYATEWTDGAVRRFLSRVGEELLPDLFALREGDVRGRGFGEDPNVEIGELKVRIERQLQAQTAFKITDLKVTGGDVMRVLGRPAGPVVGQVLRQLLDRVLDDPTLNERDRLEALIPEIAGAAPSNPSR